MAGRTYSTEAVVLRSFRLGEADRVLHLYTLDRGRIGAIAKGIRKTKSRFGARLEPHAEPRFRLSDPLRDRTDPAAVERVEVEDAVGLAEAKRPENHCLRAVCASSH